MRNERGSLVLAMMALVLLGALGASLVIITNTEMQIAGNYGLAQEGFYAAEAGLEIVSQELATLADWGSISAGLTLSTFVDGPPQGDRQLSDGSVLSLTVITASLDSRGWRLFAFSPLSRLQAVSERHSTSYVVVWVADDPRGQPDVLALRAEAFGPRGTRRAVEAVVSRQQGTLSWIEVW
ncbi:MAG TPA: pilus assembly PilX N-terminal domain-containing protein [Vicinamibacterales bacterium]|nr:pilus assembly PilX N-terminal domain-containing protein [Vicinamibacterales bacterium]